MDTNCVKVEEESTTIISDVPRPICEDTEDTDDDETVSIDKRLRRMQRSIDEVDAFLRQLNERKAELLTKYDKLKEEKMVQKSLALSTRNWDGENFAWSDDMRHLLTNTFRMESYRPQQLQTINALMARHDVLLLAPTGGGKSLCYQLPALFSKGITIIVSPLLALMENQIWALQKLGIEAEMLCQSTDRTKNNTILKVLADSSDKCSLKLLYVTPERMAKSKRFRTALQKSYFAKKLNFIAIDEVHCCSQWGHDFRPDYKFLGSLKQMYPDVPIVGVTATATSKVIIDLQKMLNIRDCLVLRAPFNRPNLYYHVVEKPSEKVECNKLLATLLKERYHRQSGIIYTFSVRDADDLASELVKRGVSARPYHASLTADRRTETQTKWLRGDLQVVVATVAFGMGIDKPDVRFVIHHTISKSMENFYQESGRAGRDGLRAECVLLYRFGDVSKITTMMFTERTGLKNAYEMVKYCINGTRCRRDIISDHFSEVWDDNDCNKMCDRCYHKDRVKPPQIDIKQYCLELYSILEKCQLIENNVTGIKLINAWYKTGPTNLRSNSGQAPKMDRYYAEQVVGYLICENYLCEDFHFTPYATLSYIKRGAKNAADETSIPFDRARILDLPALNARSGSTDCAKTPQRKRNGQSSSTCTAIVSADEVEFVSESKLKRKKSSSKRSDKDVNLSMTATPTTTTLGKPSRLSLVDIAVEKENKRRRVFAEDEPHTTVRADGVTDDVLVLQTNGIVIEID